MSRTRIRIAIMLMIAIATCFLTRQFLHGSSPSEQIEEEFTTFFYDQWERMCTAKGEFRPPLPVPGVRPYTGQEGDCQGRLLLNRQGHPVCGPRMCLICCTKRPQPR